MSGALISLSKQPSERENQKTSLSSWLRLYYFNKVTNGCILYDIIYVMFYLYNPKCSEMFGGIHSNIEKVFMVFRPVFQAVLKLDWRYVDPWR